MTPGDSKTTPEAGQIWRATIHKLKDALEQCAAPFVIKPSSSNIDWEVIAREFYRRMAVAKGALEMAPSDSPTTEALTAAIRCLEKITYPEDGKRFASYKAYVDLNDEHRGNVQTTLDKLLSALEAINDA